MHLRATALGCKGRLLGELSSPSHDRHGCPNLVRAEPLHAREFGSHGAIKQSGRLDVTTAARSSYFCNSAMIRSWFFKMSLKALLILLDVFLVGLNVFLVRMVAWFFLIVSWLARMADWFLRMSF